MQHTLLCFYRFPNSTAYDIAVIEISPSHFGAIAMFQRFCDVRDPTLDYRPVAFYSRE